MLTTSSIAISKETKTQSFSSLVEMLTATQFALTKVIDNKKFRITSKSFYDTLDTIAKEPEEKTTQRILDYLSPIIDKNLYENSAITFDSALKLSHIYINLKRIYIHLHRMRKIDKIDLTELTRLIVGNLSTPHAPYEISKNILNLKSTALKTIIDVSTNLVTYLAKQELKINSVIELKPIKIKLTIDSKTEETIIKQIRTATRIKKQINTYLKGVPSSSLMNDEKKENITLKSFKNTIEKLDTHKKSLQGFLTKNKNKKITKVDIKNIKTKLLTFEKSRSLYEGVAILANVLHQEFLQQTPPVATLTPHTFAEKTVRGYIFEIKKFNASDTTKEIIGSAKEACLTLQEFQLTFPIESLGILKEMPELFKSKPSLDAITAWAKNTISSLREEKLAASEHKFQIDFFSRRELPDVIDNIQTCLLRLLEIKSKNIINDEEKRTLAMPATIFLNSITKQVQLIVNASDSKSLDKTVADAKIEFQDFTKDDMLEKSNGQLTYKDLDVLSNGFFALINLKKLNFLALSNNDEAQYIGPTCKANLAKELKHIGEWAHKEYLDAALKAPAKKESETPIRTVTLEAVVEEKKPSPSPVPRELKTAIVTPMKTETPLKPLSFYQKHNAKVWGFVGTLLGIALGIGACFIPGIGPAIGAYIILGCGLTGGAIGAATSPEGRCFFSKLKDMRKRSEKTSIAAIKQTEFPQITTTSSILSHPRLATAVQTTDTKETKKTSAPESPALCSSVSKVFKEAQTPAETRQQVRDTDIKIRMKKVK